LPPLIPSLAAASDMPSAKKKNKKSKEEQHNDDSNTRYSACRDTAVTAAIVRDTTGAILGAIARVRRRGAAESTWTTLARDRSRSLAGKGVVCSCGKRGIQIRIVVACRVAVGAIARRPRWR
jgi:hypothetical protein